MLKAGISWSFQYTIAKLLQKAMLQAPHFYSKTMQIRPFLKWAGSKQRCLDKILPHLPQANRLVEPFTGAGTIFLNTQYSHYLLGEINADLINLYNILKHEHQAFIEYCQQSFFQGHHQNELSYYQLRDDFNLSQDDKHRAALFLYLNRHGFNGLCRYNQSGVFNVPYGSHGKKGPYFPHKELGLFAEKAQKAEFVCQDFRTTMSQCQKGDVIYCDPPYMPLNVQSKGFAYHQKAFTIEEQAELASMAMKAKKKNIPVLISNHDTEATRQLYKHADIISFPVRRYISRDAHSRQCVKELIAVYQ